MANMTRISSKRVLPGSFWCELFTYRWMTAEPGSLSKIIWAVVRVYSKKPNSGSNVVEELFIVTSTSQVECDYINILQVRWDELPRLL